MYRPKILIIGSGRHGKDEVARILSEKYGFSFQSSSWLAAEAIFPVLQAVFGFESVQEAFDNRHADFQAALFTGRKQLSRTHRGSLRKVWKECIQALDDQWIADAIRDYDMFVGMRTRKDYNKFSSWFDETVWVDASERVEYREPADVLELNEHDASYILRNNGTLECLEEAVHHMVQGFGGTYDG